MPNNDLEKFQFLIRHQYYDSISLMISVSAVIYVIDVAYFHIDAYVKPEKRRNNRC